MHKMSEPFKIKPDRTSHNGVTCPLLLIYTIQFHINALHGVWGQLLLLPYVETFYNMAKLKFINKHTFLLNTYQWFSNNIQLSGYGNKKTRRGRQLSSVLKQNVNCLHDACFSVYVCQTHPSPVSIWCCKRQRRLHKNLCPLCRRRLSLKQLLSQGKRRNMLQKE